MIREDANWMIVEKNTASVCAVPILVILSSLEKTKCSVLSTDLTDEAVGHEDRDAGDQGEQPQQQNAQHCLGLRPGKGKLLEPRREGCVSSINLRVIDLIGNTTARNL